jgi:DNA-binding response OmpR family regulator
MAKILIVDDDVDLSSNLKKWLTKEQHVVELVHTGGDAIKLMEAVPYEAVILDWQLPDTTGLDLCKHYRSIGGTASVLMLTGRSAVTDKLAGLDSGADDYLTKPFDLREVSARLRAILRRPQATVQPTVLSARDVVLDPVKHEVRKDGKLLRLLPIDFALLSFFMRHPNTVFSADALLERVWTTDSEATSDSLRCAIRRIRQSIDTDGEESMIETISKVGYKLRP